MDENLMDLRQSLIKTSTRFLRAQRVYLDAAAPNVGFPQSALKEAARQYLKAAEPYDAALQGLRQYLLAAEPSEVIVEELERTERLIDALDKEKMVVLKLIAHYKE